MAELVYFDLGRKSYKLVLQLQKLLWERVSSSEQQEAYLILVEHDPPVLTLGRNANAEHVLASQEKLKSEGIEIHKTNRGGDVTYHGPGQLVGYLIIRLDLHGRNVHGYIRDLEEVIIRLLAEFDIKANRIPGLTGVWVGDEKIAAIGITLKRWISYHGFAINVSPNLSHFDLIVPCGIRNKRVTSMQRLLKRKINTEKIKPSLVKCIREVFDFDSAVRGVIDDELLCKK